MAFNDSVTADKIMIEEKPAKMKRLGKNITGFSHSVWNNRKVQVMEEGLRAKFKILNLRNSL